MSHKIAKDRHEAFKIGEKFEGKPHGWIQWKGTNVCMDINCKCGYLSHIDADYLYSVQCPKCKTSYALNGHIELIELMTTPDDVKIAEF